MIEERGKKGLSTAKMQKKKNVWSPAREKVQDTSYRLNISTSSRLRGLNIWEVF